MIRFYTCPMRIGIDTRLNFYRPGGIAQYTRHLIQELAALSGKDAFYIIHHHEATDSLTPAPNFRRVNTRTPSHHRFERYALSVELAPWRLDVLHSPDMIPPQRGARRHVITIHDLHFLHFPAFMTPDSHRYYTDQIKWAVQHADHILVDSQATRADLADLLHVPANKMTVHMLGVDAVYKPLPQPDVEAGLQRNELPDEYILFVGTYEPRKNITGLLEAYSLLRRRVPDAPPLALVGWRGWLYEEIFARAKELDLLTHTLWLEHTPTGELPAIYNGASMLVLPSHYEGFGLPALEAMACGTPAIVSDRSSLPEVVGSAGLLVDPNDAESIADAMYRVLTDSDLRQRLREQGLTRAATFTWKQTAETALDAYRRVATR